MPSSLFFLVKRFSPNKTSQELLTLYGNELAFLNGLAERSACTVDFLAVSSPWAVKRPGQTALVVARPTQSASDRSRLVHAPTSFRPRPTSAIPISTSIRSHYLGSSPQNGDSADVIYVPWISLKSKLGNRLRLWILISSMIYPSYDLNPAGGFTSDEKLLGDGLLTFIFQRKQQTKETMASTQEKKQRKHVQTSASQEVGRSKFPPDYSQAP